MAIWCPGCASDRIGITSYHNGAVAVPANHPQANTAAYPHPTYTCFACGWTDSMGIYPAPGHFASPYDAPPDAPDRCRHCGFLNSGAQVGTAWITHRICGKCGRSNAGAASQQSIPQPRPPAPPAAPRPTRQSQTSGQPQAIIEKVWTEHNVILNGQKGFRIHTRFQANGLKQTPCLIVAHFQFGNGQKLKDFNQSYCDNGGFVAVGETFTPRFDASLYEDYTLFMPYDELHLTRGNKHQLQFVINLFVKAPSQHLKRSTPLDFWVNQA